MHLRFTSPFRCIVALILLGTCYFIAGTQQVQAQSTGYNEYSIISTPTNPAPNQEMTLEVISLSSDVNVSDISWYTGNQLLQKGVGLSKITITAPSSGSSITIRATITKKSGEVGQASLLVRVGEVNITWETNGYTPPFYKGRAPYTYQSTLRLVALPNLYNSTGTLIPPSSLSYRWSKDHTVLGNESGFNKQTLSVKGAIVPRPITITVDVESRDKTVKGQGTIIIDAVEPQVVFYEQDPLYGALYNNALGDSFTLTNEKRVIAEPYFFSITQKTSPNLRYTWSVNNLEAQDIQNDTGITLRPKGSAEGSALISVRVDNLSDILQSASKGLQVYFSKAAESQLPIF